MPRFISLQLLCAVMLSALATGVSGQADTAHRASALRGTPWKVETLVALIDTNGNGGSAGMSGNRQGGSWTH